MLTAGIHKVETGAVRPYLMGFPAVFLPVCALAPWLFEDEAYGKADDWLSRR
ncbi:hypothetical protein [Actinoplanes couchii]|uniref:Uncharacterized protein n=1 Tax=Actinoplanes couchii TaxID=403638 RepID=A0ABQ3X299_9ACTN|nr:hypothetical protein [Actinoplanes couchii]MDR6316926.1 hypothetical protein [Actinoplanes couchii]GID52533.1 hypothetical protein Aco03nite_009370 [Actinoplanes couchii]